MNWRSQAGKSAFIKMLMQDHGVSKRKAEQAVNACFHCMTQALRRGEVVELPVGWIRAVTPSKKITSHFQKLRNIQSEEIFRRLVHPPKRIIRFRPDPQQIQRGPDPPSAATIRQLAEVNQLFVVLTRRPMNELDFDRLYRAADQNLAWLLARLQDLAKSGFDFSQRGVLSLAHSVYQSYWIRPSSRPPAHPSP